MLSSLLGRCIRVLKVYPLLTLDIDEEVLILEVASTGTPDKMHVDHAPI